MFFFVQGLWKRVVTVNRDLLETNDANATLCATFNHNHKHSKHPKNNQQDFDI